ncbi:ubiquinone biosynthesis protein UbiH, partial [Escherichia coli]|nr:ubiquinone biosynthesis protein UbiH [Escherichia coli]
VVAAGLLEVDLLDVEVDSMMEGSGQTEGLAGLLYRFKLDGVPVTLVLTLLFFFGWFICYFIELWLLRHLPLGILRYPLGLVVIVG